MFRLEMGIQFHHCLVCKSSPHGVLDDLSPFGGSDPLHEALQISGCLSSLLCPLHDSWGGCGLLLVSAFG